jgi:hypothetical protein
MKRYSKNVLSLLVATLMITTSIIVLADWDPDVDGHKMHYPQLPDPFGWDVLATTPEIVADDWQCSESGYVSDIHFWGSWLYDLEGLINGFWITIFSDIPDPDGPGPLYSMPGDILWQAYISDFDILFWDSSPQGWFEPIGGWWELDNHMNYYQYNLMNIPEPFYQEEGTIYWLGICADVMTEYPNPPLWGWKTSLEHWNDDATWSIAELPYMWNELRDPIEEYSLDMAFVINGSVEPEQREFGDAPEDALAYPSTMTNGWFPTCKTCGVDGWIQHNNFGAWFGPAFEFETDGNAGLCPGSFPPYDQDEGFQDGDAGLLMPEPFTIDPTPTVVPFTGFIGTSLGIINHQAYWGTDIDIEVHNHMPSSTIGFVNVLMDWNQDGDWKDPGERILFDQPIPNPFDGPISALIGGTSFTIGPNPGYVWTRFTISELQLGAAWFGEGNFEDGESEDYLLRIDDEPIEAEYGDAPEGAIAYPSTMTMGSFPTCACCGPSGFVRHHFVWEGSMFFGPMRDTEWDGNAGLCPIYPPYDQDEGFWGGPDGGLMAPDIYTIDSTINVVPLATVGMPYLGYTNAIVTWGIETDIFVQNWAPIEAFVNVLADWNQNGQWGEPGEHILLNQIIPPSYNGPISLLMPPPFMTGPNPGYVWFRFTITPMPLPPDWNGEGELEDGETEDYLLLIISDDPPTACYTWSDPDDSGAGTSINFDASCSTDDNGISYYEWDWTSDGTYDYTGGPTVSYDYGDTLPHNCTLRVTDTIGQKDTFTDMVQAIAEAEDINQSVFDRGFPVRHTWDGDWGSAQNFTPTFDTFTSAKIYLRKFGSPEFNLTVEIRLNHPTGTLYDTLIFTPAEIASSWQWLPLNFTDIPVGSGTNLFIVLPPAPSTVTTSFGYEWGYAFDDQYWPGSFWFTRDGGVLWRDLPTRYEFVFKTYGYN